MNVAVELKRVPQAKIFEKVCGFPVLQARQNYNDASKVYLNSDFRKMNF